MKRVLSLIGLSILVLSLVFGCAPETAPPAEEAPPPGEEEEAPPPEEEAPAVIEWRYHTPLTEARVEYAAIKDWCDTIYEATDGHLKVTIYGGRSLGFKDDDMLRICGGGTIESFMSYPGYVSRDEPAMAMILPNFVLQNQDEYLGIFPYAVEQIKELYAEWNIRVLTEYPQPVCYVCLVAEESLNTVEAMKGKKIRCWDTVQAEALKSLGIPAEIFPQSDAYLALKTGMIDGSLHSVPAAGPQSLHEVVDYFSVIGISCAPQGIACNEDAFQALPADVQDIVLQVSKEHQQKIIENARDCSNDEEAIEWLREQGMIILPEFSDEEKLILSDAANKVWVARAEEYGAKAVEYQKRMQTELERLRAS